MRVKSFMKSTYCGFCAASLCLLVSLGCGGSKNPTTLGNKNDKLFQSADPGIKASWDTAIAALKTNGYVPAIVSLQEITQGTNSAVTPEQVKAAGETVTAISDSMYTAANKGDAKAQEAITELRKVMGR